MSHRDEYASACRDPIRVEVQQMKAPHPAGRRTYPEPVEGKPAEFQRESGVATKAAQFTALVCLQTAPDCPVLQTDQWAGARQHMLRRPQAAPVAVPSSIAIPVVQIVMCVEPP
jgi:hypothetical protein